MNKKGFTLAELLGVIVILMALSLIAIPPLLNVLNKTKTKISDATYEIYRNATNMYLDENGYRYDFNDGIFYIKLDELVKAGKLVPPLKDSVTGKEISSDFYFVIKNIEDKLVYELTKDKPQGIDLAISQFIVTFDPVGGSVGRTSKIVVSGRLYGRLPIPTKENSEFLGWYTTLDEQGKIIDENSTVVLSSDITLYAKWK